MKQISVISLIALLIVFLSCKQETTQERKTLAYKGHENDMDAMNMVVEYPELAGTRLDNCQMCHRWGIENTDTEAIHNACDYCHLIPFPNPRYKSGVPRHYRQTLNSYGLAYADAGRNRKALQKIADTDADGDGFSNEQEIRELRYPGDPASNPDQQMIPFITLNREDLQKVKSHHQFLLLNHTRHSTDEYVSFTGIKLKDLLEYVGVDLTGASGITAFAPDGFSIDFTLEEILNPFPEADFYDFREDAQFAETLLEYSSEIPEGLKNSDLLTDELWLIIALERDGKTITPAYYDEEQGHIEGAGPYRIVAPQCNPGRPDRGIRVEKRNDGWDFDESLDHNAGRCIRGMCVIRVNPMPAGYEAYDWRNGWNLIRNEELIIYGYGVPVKE